MRINDVRPHFNKFWSITLAFVFLALGFIGTNAAWAQQPSKVEAVEPAPTLLVLGDSISAEYGLARGQGWVHLVEQKLKAQNPEVKVINASISGETTAGGRSRIAALLRQHTPTHVIIELGGNDALRGLSLTNTQSNLEAMVSAAQASGAKVLLLGIQVPPNYGKRYTQQFAETFVQVAQDKSVDLVPFFLEVVSAPEDVEKYFQADRIHPNAAAHPLIANAVFPAIEKLLKP